MVVNIEPCIMCMERDERWAQSLCPPMPRLNAALLAYDSEDDDGDMNWGNGYQGLDTVTQFINLDTHEPHWSHAIDPEHLPGLANDHDRIVALSAARCIETISNSKHIFERTQR